MNKQCIIGLIIACLTISCNPKAENNHSDVEQLIIKGESIIDRYDSAVLKALNNNKLKSVTIISNTVIDSTNIILNDLKSITIVPEDEVLRESAINYVKALQNVINAESSYALLGDTTNIAQAKILDNKVLQEINAAEQMRYKYRLAYKQSEN